MNSNKPLSKNCIKKLTAKEENIIYILSEVNEIYAKTEMKQIYKNNFQSSIEIKVQFPIIKDINISKFIVKINEKIIVSKILESEKGKEKFNDEISIGNSAFYGKIEDSGEKMEIYIGNLLPKKILEIKTIFFQKIISEDMSYCFNLIQSYPKILYLNENNSFSYNYMTGIKCNIYLSTQSHLTRFIVLNKRRDINYFTDFSDSLTFVKIKFEKISNKIFQSLNYSCLKILFRTENINFPILYAQYDENKNETSYLINFMFSNIQIPSKFSQILNSNDESKLQFFSAENFIDSDPKISYYHQYGIKSNIFLPACFIFLIDQSGSMSGEPIKILKETLILFLKSLPFESYFQVIGFGTSFIKYNEYPILYNENNIKEMIEKISTIKANLGLTKLYEPLLEVYQQFKSKEFLNLPINIIIITDGKVSNVGKCVDLIDENKENFRVHSIGIGENYDKFLIEKTANVGRGLKLFIDNVENIYYKIFNILNVFTNYLKNIQIEIINNLDYFDKKNFVVFSNESFINQNDIIFYGFICPGKIFSPKENIKLSINFLNNNNENLNNNKIVEIKNIETLKNGNELSKLIVGTLINNNSFNKNLEKNTIIQLSKTYEILSKYTCLFGCIKNEENKSENLININNFYLPDNISTNVQISHSKTGKHGHAKVIKTILNKEEVELNELIKDYSDSEYNEKINFNSKDFMTVKKIIDEQNIENGNWENKSFNDEKYEKIYKKILEYFTKENIEENLLTKIICTFSIIYFLEQEYFLYKNIWNQVVNKGLIFLKKNNIYYDKTLKEIDLDN